MGASLPRACEGALQARQAPVGAEGWYRPDVTRGDAEGVEDVGLAETAAAPPSLDPTLASTVAVGISDAPPLPSGPLRPFGPFTRVERLLEQGAMGVVARGYNAAFDRWELLKFLHPDLEGKPEFVRQFFREGRVLAKLSHPNIVQVFAIYAHHGRPCLAMEFLEGVSLAAQTAKERSSIARWHELFLDAARGLAAAHDVGLLHRDLKPENLFVVHDRAGAPKGLKLIDFGLATVDRSRHTDAESDPTLIAAMSGGTPLYMAPELWSGQEASVRTDVYSLGQSFFLALTGRLPFVADTVGQLRAAVCSDDPFTDARELRPDLPAPLALVLARTIAKNEDDRISTADELVAALVAAASAARPRRVPGAGPYRGLGSYSAAERDVFFGRDTEVAEVLEHLRTQSGVVLVGPGGSGKSSLAQAGVVPAIEEGALGGGISYGSVLLQPRAHPVQSLAAALARRLGSAEKEVLAFLEARPASLGESLRAALPPEAGVVLVVDQLEELATVAEDPVEIHAFAVAIGSLLEVGSAPIRVVTTLRADLMDRLFAIEPLRPLLTRGFYPVRPMGADALRQAMTGPALAASYRLEDPRIAEEVIVDVARTASGLPLLSFAMAAWWEARDEATRTLPTSAWRELGGLTGALTRHGDRVLATMNDDSRRVAEQILLRLVSADRTRTRISRKSLLDPAASGPTVAHVLERLLAAKLVHESSGELELVHDALITQWPTLRELLLSSGEDRAFRERVASAARQWDAQGRPDGALWTSDQAIRLARWFAVTDASLDQLDLAFVLAVQKRATRSRVVSRGLATSVVVVALAVGLVAKSNEREMRRRLDAANASLKERKAAYVQAETGRLNELAAVELLHDPAATLRHVAASYELEHDPTLDVMAWNARALGVAIALPGLASAVSLVSVAPYTRWIAAADSETVELLAASSAEHASIHLSAGSGRPSAIAFSPDGETLALGGATGEVVVARAPSFAMSGAGRCDGAVQQIVWPSKQSILAVCRAGPGPLRPLTIDLVSGNSTLGAALPVPADVATLDMSTSGESVVVGAPSGAVTSFALGAAHATQKPASVSQRRGGVVFVAHDPTRARGRATVSIDEHRMAEIRVDGVSRTFETEVGTRAFAWIPARDAAALVSRAGDVIVVSLTTLDVVARMPNPRHEITALAADATGEWLVGGASDGAVEAFNLEQGTVAVTQGRVDPVPSACGLSPDGNVVACASAGTAVVRVVERSTGVPRPPTQLSLAPTVDLLAPGPEGRPLFALAGGELTRDGRAVPQLVSGAVIAVSEGRIAIGGRMPNGRPAIVVAPLALDAASSPSLPPPSMVPAAVTALAWTAHGTQLLVATSDRKLRIFQLAATGPTEVSALDVPTNDAVRRVAGSDDGDKIAIGTGSGDVFLTSTRGAPMRRVAELHVPVGCLSIARSGRAVVAAAGRWVSVVDGDTGLAFPLWTSSSPVVHCSRSPGEDRFSFVQDDGTTWLKALDFMDVGASYIPADPLDVPTARGWKGLPVGLVR